MIEITKTTWTEFGNNDKIFSRNGKRKYCHAKLSMKNIKEQQCMHQIYTNLSIISPSSQFISTTLMVESFV